MSSDQQKRLERVADRFELTELMHRYAWGVDKWDWAMLEEVFAEDVEGDFSSVAKYVNGDGIVRGRKAMVDWLRTSLTKFPDVLHFMSNQLVTFKGDEAYITTYMHVLHLPMGGIYHCTAVRTDGTWRIRRFRLEERTFNEAAERLERHIKAAEAR